MLYKMNKVFVGVEDYYSCEMVVINSFTCEGGDLCRVCPLRFRCLTRENLYISTEEHRLIPKGVRQLYEWGYVK